MKKILNAIIKNRVYSFLGIISAFSFSLLCNHLTNLSYELYNGNFVIFTIWLLTFLTSHYLIIFILYNRAKLIHNFLKMAIAPLMILFYITLFTSALQKTLFTALLFTSISIIFLSCSIYTIIKKIK